MRRPQRFRERDAARAIRVVQKAGLGIGRIEINASGTIVIVPGEPDAAVNGGVLNDLDAELAAFEARHDGQG